MNSEVFDFQIRSVCAKEIKICFYKLYILFVLYCDI